MGANVIRVDKTSDVDTVPPGPSPELMNRGRRSVAIDLKHPEGAALLLEMAGAADVLLEGFRPGVMERLGLGPAECMGINPRLIYGRMTGWGQDGPYSRAPGHDLNYVALSGALEQIGEADGPPIPPINLVGDFGGGGMMLAFGVVCAVYESARSGQGQVIDAAMVDGAAVLNTCTYMLQAKGWWNGTRGKNSLNGAAPNYSVYQCADGEYVTVACSEPKFYAEFLRLLALDPGEFPALDENDWSSTRARLAEIFRTRTRAEWCELLDGTDACFAPVLSPWSAWEHPHIAHRGIFVEVEGYRQPAPAPRFSRTPGSIQGGPPHPGQHTENVLSSEFSIAAERMAKLRESFVIA
jgi:alpha-methylacyl-CoA racemase